jgi:hypothetical protein
MCLHCCCDRRCHKEVGRGCHHQMTMRVPPTGSVTVGWRGSFLMLQHLCYALFPLDSGSMAADTSLLPFAAASGICWHC